jgi:hypothetical protein
VEGRSGDRLHSGATAGSAGWPDRAVVGVERLPAEVTTLDQIRQTVDVQRTAGTAVAQQGVLD